ncbi:PI-PLC domain-containing protein [Flavitalea flava]
MTRPVCRAFFLSLSLLHFCFLFPGFLRKAASQDLSFTFPSQLLPGTSTDKSIDITQFKGGFFVTWKEAGNEGKVHVSYLGRQYDTSSFHADGMVQNGQTPFGPVLRVLNNRIYLFWIDRDGGVKYVINRSDTAFDLMNVHSLVFTGNPKLAYGITAAPFNGKILLASHGADKQSLAFALVEPGPDGLIPESALAFVAGRKSSDYPFVVSLNDTVARFTWRGYKEQVVYSTDYNIQTGSWSVSVPVAQARSKTAPAIYQIWNGERLFCIWKGPDNDNKLYYGTAKTPAIPQTAIALPGYFSTTQPVSICNVDGNKFILAFTGGNGNMYLSYFTNYNPSSWMKDLLMPSKSNYTLQDIVIPGAHDAGMSVLNGVGGSQSGTINECNTLTQKLPVKGQLNAGIRMFDLRVGTYKDTLYTKHCSSDCMADAIGGGYGEKLAGILDAIRIFLQKNQEEIVLLTFSHFCEKETPVKDLADLILKSLGNPIVYKRNGKALGEIPLRDLAGKVIVTFEHYSRPDGLIDSCTIGDHSDAFINFRREYAATNELAKFLSRQELFFRDLGDGVHNNDLVRLDWQLTQSADEAAMTCNDFQDENVNPLISGAMLLTNVIRKHQSIINLSLDGNKYLPVKLNEWIAGGKINRKNKPNIIYVDAAGGWVTDYCIGLNNSGLYNK